MPNPKAISLDEALATVAPAKTSSLDEALTAVTAKLDAPQGSFLSRLADAAVEIPLGMAKSAGRLGQMVPGMSAATDALYGLPKGASEHYMQPANTNEQAGGYLGDLALAVATGGAEAGPAMLSRSAGFVSNPTVAARGAAMAGDAAKFGADVVSAVRSRLAVGPLTADKVASLIAKYGKESVKFTLKATLGLGAYEAYKHLF